MDIEIHGNSVEVTLDNGSIAIPRMSSLSQRTPRAKSSRQHEKQKF